MASSPIHHKRLMMRLKSNGNPKLVSAGSRNQQGWQPVLPRLETYSLHIRVRAFAVSSDEAVDPRRHNGQRYRAELEHGIVERADVEFCSERFLRFFAGTHDCELAHIIREGLPGPGNVTVHFGFDLMLG